MSETADRAKETADHDGVDALIDLVSYDAESVGKLVAVVREGGRVSSTMNAASTEPAVARGLTGTNLVSMPNGEALATLVGEIERGPLRVDVAQVLPLEEAAKGFETLNAGLALGRSSSRSTTRQLPRC
jgi:NADPH:quinone reductase-like Zn-dependent oxidoreductase